MSIKPNSLASLGVKLSAPMLLPSADISIRNLSLENTAQYSIRASDFSLGGERVNPAIDLKSVPLDTQLTVGGAIAEAESILSSQKPVQKPNIEEPKTKIPEVFLEAFSEPVYKPPLLERAVPEVVLAPARLSEVEEKVLEKPDIKSINRAHVPFFIPFTHHNTHVQIEPETEMVTEEVEELVPDQESKVDDQIESEIKVEESEKEKVSRLQRVVDSSVVKVRVSEIIQAAVRSGSFIGKIIAAYMPGQHFGNRSGELNIIDPEGQLIDGSLSATIKKITESRFNSLADVYQQAPVIVAENIPVTRGEGEVVEDRDVAKVYKEYKGKVPPAQEVIKRVLKMKKQVKIVKINKQPVQIVPLEEKTEERTEKTVGDHSSELAGALLAT